MARKGRKPNSTKATTNSKSVKENKTMAKATSTKKTTTKATVNTNAKEAKDMKNTMTLSAEEMEMIKEMRAKKTAGKATPKAKQEPKAQKTESKAFDRDLYESIANELGVLGKNGVYKVARPVVYKLMELDKIKKSDITKAKEQIVAIATEQKLTWLLEKLGVEAEEEAEDVDVDFEDIAQ